MPPEERLKVTNHYYLAAQLPGFVFSGGTVTQLPITYPDFIELCSRFLEGKELQQLKGLTIEPPCNDEKTGSPMLDAWYTWERSVRLALAHIRAQRMKKEFADTTPISQDIQQIARTASGYDSPLEAERYLNNERLRVLNELTPLDPFSTDAIFVYGLKLCIAARIIQFNEEAGMESYRAIYDQILGESK